MNAPSQLTNARMLQDLVLTKKKDLADAVSNYIRAEGRSPEFILGYQTTALTVPGAKLSKCRVLNDRSQILKEMPDRGVVAEIGTQTGAFAKRILDARPNVTLFTIDIDYSQFSFDILRPYIDNNQLKTIEGTSWVELAKFPNDFFSWVYLDASHFIDHVRLDLKSTKLRVEVDGYIVCNDYTVWSPFEAQPYGVLQAVNEFLLKEDFYASHFALHPFGYHDIALRRCS